MTGATKLDPMRMVELRAGAMTSAGMAKSSNRLHYAILTVLDTVFSALVAAPAVVGYWRGTWGLSDLYVYPDEPTFSSFASITVGFAGLFAFSVLQHGLDDALHPDKHRLSYYLGSRLYTGVFGFCCVNAWRGAWKVLDIYTELKVSTVFATTAVSLLALGIMRAIRNVSAPPFSLCLDSCPGYFEVQTMFRVNVSIASTKNSWIAASVYSSVIDLETGVCRTERFAQFGALDCLVTSDDAFFLS